MIKKHSLFLLCAAALVVAGCQMDEIKPYGERCIGMQAIYYNGELQCSKNNPEACKEDFANALAIERCPTELYQCGARGSTKFCYSGCPGTQKMVVCKDKCFLAKSLVVTYDANDEEICTLQCPDTCPDSCDEYGACHCPSSCINGCDETGACLPCQDGDVLFENDPNEVCTKQVCRSGEFHPNPQFNPDGLSCNADNSGLGSCQNGKTECLTGANGETLHTCISGEWRALDYACESENLCAAMGHSKCFGDPVGQICNEAGNAFEPCPNKASCNSDNSACGLCQNGRTQCAGNMLLTCTEGAFQPKDCGEGKHCEMDANTARCVTNECENGLTKCKNNVIYQCTDHTWNVQTACICTETEGQARCSNDTEDPPTPVEDDPADSPCTDGATRCAGNAQQTCENNTWGAEVICLMGCNAQTNKCDSSSCEPNARKCNSDTAMYCNNGAWLVEQRCTNGCNPKTGACYPQCAPGERRCDGTNALTCNEEGTWNLRESCGLGCDPDTALCISDTCIDGDKRCDGQTAKNCVDSTWIASDCTSLNSCDVQGNPEKAICMASCAFGAQTCQNGKMFVCTDTATNDDIAYNYENGAFWLPNGNTCTCTPGEKACDGRNTKTCGDDGTWSVTSCPDGCNASTGECRTGSCEDGLMVCQNGNYANCINGSWDTLPGCKEYPETCTNLIGYACNPCKPNLVFCYRWTNLYQYKFICQTDGNSWLLTETCQGSQCDLCN